MNVNLNLRNAQNGIRPNLQKETPINLVIRWNSLRLVYPTRKKVKPIDWKAENQKVRKTNVAYMELNTYFNYLESKVRKAFTDFQNEHDRDPNTQEFRAYLKTVIEEKTKPKKVAKMTLTGLIELKIKLETKRLNAVGKRIGSSSVVYAYERLLQILLGFKKTTGNKIDFENITMDWYYSFIEYLSNEEYKPNYRGKIIKNLKAIMNFAIQEGFSSNLVHKNKFFKKEQESVYKTYLNESEINHLINFDFGENERLKKVSDFLVIACRTGLRVSDLKRIEKKHIEETQIESNGKTFSTNFLRIKTLKTKKEVDIPLHPNVTKILNTYNFKIPLISDTKFNEYIKEACSVAGINKICEFTEIKGSNEIIKAVPKYTLISSHTGRRSFATNLYKEGVPILSIMAITGHSKIKDFLNYIVLDANEKAKSLAIHYNNQELKI